MSILKSFADWEQLRSDSSKQGSIVESREEDASRSLATSNPSISATVMLGSNQILRDSVVQSLKELAEKPAEQIFVNSVKLPSDSIVEFFTALCGVSAEELKQTPARVFSLQKLVEISYYNMARIRLVCSVSCSLCHPFYTIFPRQ